MQPPIDAQRVRIASDVPTRVPLHVRFLRDDRWDVVLRAVELLVLRHPGRVDHDSIHREFRRAGATVGTDRRGRSAVLTRSMVPPGCRFVEFLLDREGRFGISFVGDDPKLRP